MRTNQLSIPRSQSILIWKSFKGISPQGGGGGTDREEEQEEQPVESQ
jgi:hypothetical protein